MCVYVHMYLMFVGVCVCTVTIRIHRSNGFPHTSQFFLGMMGMAPGLASFKTLSLSSDPPTCLYNLAYKQINSHCDKSSQTYRF